MIVSMAYLTAQFFDALRMRDLREPGRMQVEPLHDNWDLRSLEGTIPFSRICPGTYIIEAITEEWSSELRSRWSSGAIYALQRVARSESSSSCEPRMRSSGLSFEPTW